MNEKKPRKRKLSDVIERLETGAAPPDPAMSAIVAATAPASNALVVAAPAAVACPPVAAKTAPAAAPKRKSGVWGIAALVAIVVVVMMAGPAVLVVFTNPLLAVIFGLAIWKLWDLS